MSRTINETRKRHKMCELRITQRKITIQPKIKKLQTPIPSQTQIPELFKELHPIPQ